MSSTASRLASVSVKRGSAPCARSTKSATASFRSSGSTGYSRSPEIRSGGSARHEERQPGRRLEHLRDDRRRFDDLLEVVEHDERPAPGEALGEALAQRTLSALAHAQRLGDRRQQERVIADRVERDEERAVGEILGKGVRSLDGQARLSGAARAGERDHTRVSPERRRHLVELAAAPDHRAHGNGHVAGGERAARPGSRPGGGSPAPAPAARARAPGRARRGAPGARCGTPPARPPGAPRGRARASAVPGAVPGAGARRSAPRAHRAPGRGARARARPRPGSRSPRASARRAARSRPATNES